MGEMQKPHMNGFIIIISLMKLALLIKLMVMIMESAVLHKSNVKIVFLVKGVGRKKEQKFMELMSTAR